MSDEKSFFARAFSENLLVKFISIVLALVIFFWVRGDRETTVTDRVSLRLVVPSGMMVVGGDPPERVRYTARGRESDLNRFDPDEVEALLVELTEEDNERPVAIPVDDIVVPSGVRITNPVPNEIIVKLERRSKKQIKIEPRIVGEPSEPYRLGEILIKPASVEITGPVSVMESLKTVYTESIDVTGQKTTYRRPVRLRLDDPMLNYDANTVFTVEIPIEAQESTRTIEGLPIIAINTSHGVVVEPDELRSLVVKGPKTIVDQLEPQSIQIVVDMSAEEQNPAGTTYSKQPTIRNLPNGVTLVSWEPKEVLVKTTPRL